MKSSIDDDIYFEDDYQEEEEVPNDKIDTRDIVVFSRDWTVETITNQIRNNNIQLNPKFQRRNVWNDDKRSKLIDSIINNYPIPEIILSEIPNRKNSFIIIDGKQRLMTLMGYVNPIDYDVWTSPKLSNLEDVAINNIAYDDLSIEQKRIFLNAAIRCTIISNIKNNNFLYILFYRLNSGSVPLSMQELRQALFHGEFADYLFHITNEPEHPIHKVMRLEQPDNRLRDIEYLLRIMAMLHKAHEYKGDLKEFLDRFMDECNKKWEYLEDTIKDLNKQISDSILKLAKLVKGAENIGRQYAQGKFTRFNRVLLEVQLYYACKLPEDFEDYINSEQYVEGLESLCQDRDFKESITSSTKDIIRYQTRYQKFIEFMNSISSLGLTNPFIR